MSPDPIPDVIQLRRTKGWRKPEGAVVVARPSKWGNPFAVGEDVPDDLRSYLVSPVAPNRDSLRGTLNTLSTVRVLTREQAVEAYAWWLFDQPHLMLALHELRGKTLACWCPQPGPCHAHVLAALAEKATSLATGDDTLDPANTSWAECAGPPVTPNRVSDGSGKCPGCSYVDGGHGPDCPDNRNLA